MGSKDYVSEDSNINASGGLYVVLQCLISQYSIYIFCYERFIFLMVLGIGHHELLSSIAKVISSTS